MISVSIQGQLQVSASFFFDITLIIPHDRIKNDIYTSPTPVILINIVYTTLLNLKEIVQKKYVYKTTYEAVTERREKKSFGGI